MRQTSITFNSLFTNFNSNNNPFTYIPYTMPPPGLPKPIRTNQTKSRGGLLATAKDVNKFINVSKTLAEAFAEHNRKHCSNREMQYEEFPEDGLTHSMRNRQAFSVIDEHLEDLLSCENETGRQESYYGKNTMSEVPRDVMKNAISVISRDRELSVYTQCANNWAIKELVKQKMSSKCRKYRSSKSKAPQPTAAANRVKLVHGKGTQNAEGTGKRALHHSRDETVVPQSPDVNQDYIKTVQLHERSTSEPNDIDENLRAERQDTLPRSSDNAKKNSYHALDQLGPHTSVQPLNTLLQFSSDDEENLSRPRIAGTSQDIAVNSSGRENEFAQLAEARAKKAFEWANTEADTYPLNHVTPEPYRSTNDVDQNGSFVLRNHQKTNTPHVGTAASIFNEASARRIIPSSSQNDQINALKKQLKEAELKLAMAQKKSTREDSCYDARQHNTARNVPIDNIASASCKRFVAGSGSAVPTARTRFTHSEKPVKRNHKRKQTPDSGEEERRVKAHYS